MMFASITELPTAAGPRRAARERGWPARGRRGDQGAHSRPDHREGLILRARQKP